MRPLSQMPADHNVSDEELAARVDALVKAHLLHVSTQMLGLQAALASAGAAPFPLPPALSATSGMRACGSRNSLWLA